MTFLQHNKEVVVVVVIVVSSSSSSSSSSSIEPGHQVLSFSLLAPTHYILAKINFKKMINEEKQYYY